MKFRQLLEKWHTDIHNDPNNPMFENPTRREMTELGMKILRFGFDISLNNVYVWDGNKSIHYSASKFLRDSYMVTGGVWDYRQPDTLTIHELKSQVGSSLIGWDFVRDKRKALKKIKKLVPSIKKVVLAGGKPINIEDIK